MTSSTPLRVGSVHRAWFYAYLEHYGMSALRRNRVIKRSPITNPKGNCQDLKVGKSGGAIASLAPLVPTLMMCFRTGTALAPPIQNASMHAGKIRLAGETNLFYVATIITIIIPALLARCAVYTRG